MNMVFVNKSLLGEVAGRKKVEVFVEEGAQLFRVVQGGYYQGFVNMMASMSSPKDKWMVPRSKQLFRIACKANQL